MWAVPVPIRTEGMPVREEVGTDSWQFVEEAVGLDEQKQIAIHDEFSVWLEAQGYVSADGVLSVALRDAEALWYQTLIQEDREEIEKRFVRISRSLWAVYSQAYWDELGYDNFEQLLKSPGIDIAVSVGYSLKTIGQLLEQGTITEQQAVEIGPSKLRALLPAIKENPENINELLDKATELNYLDLVDEVSGKEVAYYRGKGLLTDLIQELKKREEFWVGEITLSAKTCV